MDVSAMLLVVLPLIISILILRTMSKKPPIPPPRRPNGKKGINTGQRPGRRRKGGRF